MRLEIPVTPEPNSSFRIPAGAIVYGQRPAISAEGKFCVILDVEFPNPPTVSPSVGPATDER